MKILKVRVKDSILSWEEWEKMVSLLVSKGFKQDDGVTLSFHKEDRVSGIDGNNVTARLHIEITNRPAGSGKEIRGTGKAGLYLLKKNGKELLDMKIWRAINQIIELPNIPKQYIQGDFWDNMEQSSFDKVMKKIETLKKNGIAAYNSWLSKLQSKSKEIQDTLNSFAKSNSAQPAAKFDAKKEFQKFKTLTFGGQKPREVKPDYVEWRWTNKRGVSEFLSLQLEDDGDIEVEDNGGDYIIEFAKKGFEKVKSKLQREYK